jgi:hypothetical protein
MNKISLADLRILVKESLQEQFNITVDDLANLLNRKSLFRDEEEKIGFIYDYYDKDPKLTNELLAFLSEAGREILSHIEGKVGYVDKKNLMVRLLTRETAYDFNKASIFPMFVYVSSGPEDKDTIGLMVNQDGSLEMFEGSDEASSETIDMVNRLLNPEGKQIKVYASHNFDLVNKIRETETLPANLYVSPNREHAAGYWGEDRQLFSCIVDQNDLSMESEVDWKTIRSTKISKFRFM